MKRYQIILLICLFVLIAVCINFKQYDNFRVLDPKEDAASILFLKVFYYGFLLFFLSGAAYSVYFMYLFLKNGVAFGETDIYTVLKMPLQWFSMLIAYVVITPIMQAAIFRPAYI